MATRCERKNFRQRFIGFYEEGDEFVVTVMVHDSPGENHYTIRGTSKISYAEAAADCIGHLYPQQDG